jgi:hypothetical protein
MLDVRPVAYVIPVAEQEFASLTPVVTIANYGTVPASISGHVYIYRESTGLKLYTSELRFTVLAAGATADVAALSPWSPPAPADDDYFIMCDIAVVANVTHQPQAQVSIIGPYRFDIKPVGMGPAPAAHGVTHALGGSDELEVEDLATDELIDTKYLRADGIGGLVFDVPAVGAAAVEDLTTTENDTDLRLAPDGTGGVEWSTGGAAVNPDETPQTLTDQANIDWDLSLGGAAKVTLAGDRTLNAPTNMVDGARYRLKIIQDGTGTRLLTWNAVFRFPAAVAPCLSAAPGNIDIITFDCDGTHIDCTGMTSALA